MTPTSENLSYPIGKFQKPGKITAAQRAAYLADIAAFPARLCSAAVNLSDAQLDTPYRPGGWTIRQLIHHVADSHMNAYIRFKLTLTEDNPTIRPYEEQDWAELPEARTAPISLSLDLLTHLHRRWVEALKALREEDYQRSYFHPADKATVTLETAMGLYAWHCNHHLAHLTRLVEREGW